LKACLLNTFPELTDESASSLCKNAGRIDEAIRKLSSSARATINSKSVVPVSSRKRSASLMSSAASVAHVSIAKAKKMAQAYAKQQVSDMEAKFRNVMDASEAHLRYGERAKAWGFHCALVLFIHHVSFHFAGFNGGHWPRASESTQHTRTLTLLYLSVCLALK
jgi:hypothetical protein